MYELDKETFGEFLASQRKERGYTQKELAEKLFVSDKAVSKWERALSMPDISLLIPLADILGVTVTELLEGRKMDQTAEMDAGHVELLVKKALALTEEAPQQVRERRKRNGLLFGGYSLLALLEILSGVWYQYETETDFYYVFFAFMGVLSFGFGVYFWIFMKERLPAYYDEYQIDSYSDGIFHMNVPGVHFNNRNWPYLVRSLRVWSAAGMVAMPLAGLLVALLKPGMGWGMGILQTVLFLYLGGMFLPLYILGRKFEDKLSKSENKLSDSVSDSTAGCARDMQGHKHGKEIRDGEADSVPDGKPKGKKVFGLVALLAFVVLLSGGIFLLSDAGIFAQGHCMIRMGYNSHQGIREWSASYRLLSGTMTKKIYPETEPANYEIQVETREGSLSIELTDEEGVILFSRSHMETGTYPLTLEGAVKVKIVAENHRGSFSIAPRQAAGEQQAVGIFLYGETHAQEKILEKELALWSSYYREEGMRHLFVEFPY